LALPTIHSERILLANAGQVIILAVSVASSDSCLPVDARGDPTDCRVGVVLKVLTSLLLDVSVFPLRAFSRRAS
jgi:hypothetical protein